jgi:hypothetical protein
MFGLILAVVPLVAEGAQDFTLHNRSQHDIDALYISEVNDDKWGSDILGADILKDGADCEINFKGYRDGVCYWDLKIEQSDSEGENGSTWVVKNVNLCDITDLTFMWDNDDQEVIYKVKKVEE